MFINISKHYKNQTVFNDFKIHLERNKVNVLLGPSGCGKTTLLNCIAGLTSYDGEIQIERDQISYVFQEDRLFPWFSVNKNLSIISPNQRQINKYLKRFGLYDLRNQYPSKLSGGEKQRIALIRAFIHDKDFILLDEPFKSLDYNLKWDLVNMLIKLQEERNNTILLVTHDIDVALYLGDQIHVLTKKPTIIKETIINKHKADLAHKVTMRNRINIMEKI